MTGIINEIIECRKKQNRQCIYIKSIQPLSDEDKTELEQALQAEFETSIIHRVLKNRNIEVSYTAIGRHRRRECICEH